MKNIEIKVPDGKRAEWVNNVLTLVDEDVTKRIKTFEDACRELGEEHPLVQAYRQLLEIATCEDYIRETFGADMVSYLKLRVITAALNEGWEPKFVSGEKRWYAWYDCITEEYYNAMTDEEKCCVGRVNNVAGAYSGLVYSNTSSVSMASSAFFGSRLVFKSKELAEYAGKQFINIYKDFLWRE